MITLKAKKDKYGCWNFVPKFYLGDNFCSEFEKHLKIPEGTRQVSINIYYPNDAELENKSFKKTLGKLYFKLAKKDWYRGSYIIFINNKLIGRYLTVIARLVLMGAVANKTMYFELEKNEKRRKS